jgi:hypothetical protein
MLPITVIGPVIAGEVWHAAILSRRASRRNPLR